LPDQLYIGPRWLLPSLEGVLFVALFTAGQMEVHRRQRQFGLALIGVLNLFNFGSLALLLSAIVGHHLLQGRAITAQELITWSAQVWLTNVIVFGLWFWELDRGGPAARCQSDHREPDFLFPQMVTPESSPAGWAPSFLDYLYTSFTNATAFSPTDTMPLTHWAKVLFMIQSITSLLTVTLVAARAVNILA
jgi:hypothetical protein